MASLLNVGRGLVGNKVLPYDAEIEYLESTGTQYIDTSFGNNCDFGKLDIKLDYQLLTRVGNYKWVFFVSSENSKYIGLQRNGSDNYLFNAGNPIQFPSNPSFSKKTSYHYYKYSTTINNATYGGSIPSNPILGSKNIILFSSDLGHHETCRIWFAKISYDGILVRDLIPVRVGQTGYMYDKVSGQLFGNSGTGDFILGPDI